MFDERLAPEFCFAERRIGTVSTMWHLRLSYLSLPATDFFARRMGVFRVLFFFGGSGDEVSKSEERADRSLDFLRRENISLFLDVVYVL